MKVEKEKIIKEIGVYVVAIAISLKLQAVLMDSELLSFLLKPFVPYLESLSPQVGAWLGISVGVILFVLIPLIVPILTVYKFTHSLIKTILISGIVIFLFFLHIALKGMEVALR